MNRLFATIAVLMALTFTVAESYAQDNAGNSVQVEAQCPVVAGCEDGCDAHAAQQPVVEASQENGGFVESLVRVCLDNLNYGTVTLFMAVESSFIPFPSEAVVPPAAWKAAVSDEMNVLLVILFATLGAIIGSLFNYYLALWLGRPVIYKFVNTRFGRMCLLDEEKVQKAENFFDKHGVVSTFIGRLVPVVRQLISIPAGIARMNITKFVVFTTLGALIWNVILGVLGYYMASIPGLQTEEAVMTKVKEYSVAIGYVFIAVAVFVVGVLIYKGFIKRKTVK